MDFYDFLAEDALIEIVPKFVYERKLCLLCGEFGPFTPQVRTEVPIWLAMSLRKQQKCEIIIPEWVKQFKQKIEAEEQMATHAEPSEEDEARKNMLDEMPDNWRQVLKLLEADLSVNFKSLIDRREAILKMSAHKLLQYAFRSNALPMLGVTLNNTSRSELYLIRDLVQRSFAVFQRLRALML
jgi:hypothetical protein